MSNEGEKNEGRERKIWMSNSGLEQNRETEKLRAKHRRFNFSFHPQYGSNSRSNLSINPIEIFGSN
jgi:hypothetical protein